MTRFICRNTVLTVFLASILFGVGSGSGNSGKANTTSPSPASRGDLPNPVWCVWADSRGNVSGARTNPPAIAHFAPGTYREETVARDVMRSDYSAFAHYRTTQHYEWLIPNNGTIHYRQKTTQNSKQNLWKPLLDADGKPVAIKVAIHLTANERGVLVYANKQQMAVPGLFLPNIRGVFAVRDRYPAAPQMVFHEAPESTLQWAGPLPKDDGTGGKGILYFDPVYNLYRLAPGDLAPKLTCPNTRLKELYPERRGDPLRRIFLSVIGQTAKGILLNRVDGQQRRLFLLGDTGKPRPVDPGGIPWLSKYACDGVSFWACLRSGTTGKPDRFVRWGNGPTLICDLPFSIQNPGNLLLLQDGGAPGVVVINYGKPGEGATAYVLRQSGNKTLSCSAPIRLPENSAEYWGITLSGRTLWVPTKDGKVISLPLPKGAVR